MRCASASIRTPWRSARPVHSPRVTLRFNPETNAEYKKYKQLGEEIRQILVKVRDDAREKIEQAAAPKTAVRTLTAARRFTPDASGRREYCGGALMG